MKLYVAIALAALGGFDTPLRAQAKLPPPTPFEDHGACPFEGCTYREWTAKQAVTLRTARRNTAPVAFSLKAGEKVTALTGVVVTLRPGRVQFRERTVLKGLEAEVEILPGETLYLLTYQGEGFSKVWVGGRLLTEVDTTDFVNGVCDEKPSRCPGRILEKSKTDWWIQIRNRLGQVGWTREPEKFDGKDALADDAG